MSKEDAWRDWRAGYLVGRGDEAPDPNFQPVYPADYLDGLETGEAEYGVLFDEGVAVGKYKPKH